MPLKRTLGIGALTFYGIGIILGAGIYSVLGAAAGVAREALWQSFLLSSVVALLTALSYAELATSYPQASAEFTYLRKAFPEWRGVALVTGLLVALSGAATAGTVAIAFGGYFRGFVDVPAPVVAWLLIAACAGLNLVGVKQSGWVNTAFTLLEAGGLVLFIGLGLGSDSFGDALAAVPHAGVISGTALVFFSYLGFENIANLAEEAKHPARDLPRAIFISLAVASLLYVLVALSALSLLPADQLGESPAPLADAARSRSKAFASALGGIALFATANTALVSILVASRVVYGMARDRELPAVLDKVSRRGETPWLAILVVSLAAALLVPFGNVAVVASISSFASLLAFAGVSLALIVLRYRAPDQPRPFRVPLRIGRLPVLPAMGLVSTVAVATQLDSTALYGGTGALAMFSAYSYAKHRRR
jgi:basic amino acid/polyamine antiporter, APA family